jgi:sterol desaturase/sphingolipid hydroxylase (fatty acid hydroxylase superfamily)
MSRTLVRYGYVPFMLIGLNGLGIAAVYHGWSYLWIAPILLAAIGLTFLAERIAPNHDEWNHDQADTQTNIFHAIVYEIQNINGVLLIPLLVWLLPSADIWPTEWPLLLQLVIAVLFADFVFMVIHMLSHKYPLLWRLHAVHHGVSRLYGFNGLVRHPLHQALDMVVGTLPLVLMGMPTDVAILLGMVIAIQLTVQHANVSYELGPFRNVMSIGQLHHLHHVNWGTEGDCNFGLFLTLWDRLFGTFNPNPSRTITAADMGIDEVPNFPKTYWEQLLFPLHYKPGNGAAAWDRRTMDGGPTPAE